MPRASRSLVLVLALAGCSHAKARHQEGANSLPSWAMRHGSMPSINASVPDSSFDADGSYLPDSAITVARYTLTRLDIIRATPEVWLTWGPEPSDSILDVSCHPAIVTRDTLDLECFSAR